MVLREPPGWFIPTVTPKTLGPPLSSSSVWAREASRRALGSKILPVFPALLSRGEKGEAGMGAVEAPKKSGPQLCHQPAVTWASHCV